MKSNLAFNKIKTFFYDIDLNHVAFVRKDLNDKKAMKISRVTFCPTDAHQIIKENSNSVLKTKGGEGVSR